jgi:O-antigen/teichoic acid export membrane protein
MNLFRRNVRSQARAKHGVALSITAGVLNVLVNIALFPLIISTLGAAEYGIWLFIVAISQYFFYSDLGIGSAIIYYASRARGGNEVFSFDQLISNGVAWASTILFIALPLFLVIAYQYAHFHGSASGLTHGQIFGVILVGGLLLTSIVVRPYESVLIGSGHLALNIANQIAGNALRTILVVTLCLTNANLTAIAAAEAAGLCLGPVLATIYVVRKGIARLHISDVSISNVRGLFRYSLKTFSVDVVSVGALYAGTIMVGLIKGPAPAAYFALAMKVFNGAGQVITWATAPALPVLSQIWHTDPATSRALVRDLLKIVATVGFICIVPIALSSVIWIPHWVADDGLSLGTGACVVIVLVALTSNTILDPVVLACDSFGRPGVVFPAQLASAALFVIIGIPLTRSYGIVGTAAGLAVAMWIVQPLCLLILSRTLNMAFRSDVASCYRLPALVLLVGGALAACAEFVAMVCGLNGGWFTPLGFLVGAVAAMLIMPVGREAIEGSRRLLELPM